MLLGGVSVAARAAPVFAQRSSDARVRGRDLASGLRTNVVRVRPLLPNGQPSTHAGFGLITGYLKDYLYIATANHVVRDETDPDTTFSTKALVRFFEPVFGDGRQGYYGEQLPQYLASNESPGDLAALRVPLPTPPRSDDPVYPTAEPNITLRVMQVINPVRIQPAAPVWSIGRGNEWLIETQPGAYQKLERSTGLLRFEGLLVAPGSSGGAILTETGLAAMSLQTDAQGITVGFPAQRIYEQFAEWGLPVNLLQSDRPTVEGDNASYLVFFDWQRSDLTDRGRQITQLVVQELVRRLNDDQLPRVILEGHADDVGADSLRLARRRAEAVAAQLVQSGTPREAITTKAYGHLTRSNPTNRVPSYARVDIHIE